MPEPTIDLPRASRLLAEAGIDLLLASRRHNVGYLTGCFAVVYWEYPEVAHCLEREDDGCDAPYYFVGLPREPLAPGRGAFVVAHRPQVFKDSWLPDIRLGCWRDPKSTPVAQIIDAVRSRGLERAAIGIEFNHLPVGIYESLRQALPLAKFVDATPTLGKMRSVKTPREHQRQRRAYEVAEDVYQAVFRRLAQPGKVTVGEVRGMQMAMVAEADCSPMHFGYVYPQKINHPAGGWGAANDATIEPGDAVLFDLGLIYKGYTTDFGRNAVLGKATAKLKEGYAKMVTVRRAIEAALRPGAKASDAWHAATQARQRLGMDIHPSQGHGLGVECHEMPVLASYDHTVLEEGMVIVIELVHAAGGVNFLLEDGGIVTADGWKSMTRLGTELLEIATG